MNESETTQTREDVVDRTIRDAGSIGKVWARYGLLAGRNALEASSVTLGKVANLLEDLATNFKEDQETIETKGEEVVDEPREREAAKEETVSDEGDSREN